jgi:ADP-ribose pyrophosphatase YjhB (NUDIX family)
VHAGGPFWGSKDDGAWSIPKGEIDADEDPEKAARREFSEELGPSASIGEIRKLGEVRQRGGKHVVAFAGEADFDPASLSPSRSSGRRGADAVSLSRKSIGPSGSTLKLRGRSCCSVRSSFSMR